jgi:hypothetical protein
METGLVSMGFGANPHRERRCIFSMGGLTPPMGYRLRFVLVVKLTRPVVRSFVAFTYSIQSN